MWERGWYVQKLHSILPTKKEERGEKRGEKLLST